MRLIVIGVSVVVLVGIATVAVRTLVRSVPEVQVARARPVDSAPAGALSATGYIIAHHKIDVNSKVTGRMKWIGVEKGNQVQSGEVLVELEDEEFKAQVEQARGQVESARAYLHELQAGSRPQEIEQAGNNLEEARATMRDDKVTFDRTLQLTQASVLARQQLDDAQARYEADVQKVASLSQTYTLTKIGPRQEEIQRARGNCNPSRRTVGVRRVAACGDENTRTCDRDDSRTHSRKRRIGHFHICERGRRWPTRLGSVGGRSHGSSGGTRHCRG